jgi:hypothetical protein
MIGLDEHHVCLYRKCSACFLQIRQDLVDDHLTDCKGWKTIALRVPLNVKPSCAIGAVLSPTTKFPLLEEYISTMTAWMESPTNTAIADFEYLTLHGFGKVPCQVAIVDGYGEWIIPPTTINHGITKGELLAKVMSVREMTGLFRYSMTSMVHTHYHGRRDEITKGMSCHEIADLMDKYVKVGQVTESSPSSTITLTSCSSRSTAL